jgi:hypothetical protein
MRCDARAAAAASAALAPQPPPPRGTHSQNRKPPTDTAMRSIFLAVALLAGKTAATCADYGYDCGSCVNQLSDWTGSQCEYCPADNTCASGSDYTASCSESWVTDASMCGTHNLPSLNPAMAALYAAECVAYGVFDMFESVITMVEDIEELADGQITSVCTAMLGNLQGKATSQLAVCSPATLCDDLVVMGPEAPEICDLVFMGICIENEGTDVNPCGWLLDQFTGGNSNVCDQIEESLGLIPAGH